MSSCQRAAAAAAAAAAALNGFVCDRKLNFPTS